MLHAPGFVVNAGGVIEGMLTTQEGTAAEVRTQAARRIDAIEGTTLRVLDVARRQERRPHAVALEMAKARVDAQS